MLRSLQTANHQSTMFLFIQTLAVYINLRVYKWIQVDFLHGRGLKIGDMTQKLLRKFVYKLEWYHNIQFSFSWCTKPGSSIEDINRNINLRIWFLSAKKLLYFVVLLHWDLQVFKFIIFVYIRKEGSNDARIDARL